MERINIDDMRITWVEDHIKHYKALAVLCDVPKRTYMVHAQSYNKSVGLLPERLRDWRALERRHHALSGIATALSNALRNSIRELSRLGTEKGSDGQIWIPQRGYDYVDVYDNKHDSLSTKPFKELFDKALPRPGFKPVIVAGADLKRLWRLQERIRTMRHRVGAYYVAWRMAVNERLKEHVERTAHTLLGGMYHSPCTFVFSNDDRVYVVTSDDRARLVWHEGNVMFDSKIAVPHGAW